MVDHALSPARITLKRIAAEHVELYRAIPSPGENIPKYVNPSHIYDSVPIEEDIDWLVRISWGQRLGGPSRMCAKNLWEWLREH